MHSLVGINPQAWLREHRRENARLIEVAAVSRVEVSSATPAPLPARELVCC